MATRGQKYFHKLNFVTQVIFYLAHLNYSLTDSMCSLWIFHYLALLCIILHHVAFDVIIHYSTSSRYYLVRLMDSFSPTKTPVFLIKCSLFQLFVVLYVFSCYYNHTISLLLIGKNYCIVFFCATRFHLSCVIFTSATFQLQLCFLSSN